MPLETFDKHQTETLHSKLKFKNLIFLSNYYNNLKNKLIKYTYIFISKQYLLKKN